MIDSPETDSISKSDANKGDTNPPTGRSIEVDQIAGCILGTALGDAAGLRREGLSARRGRRIYGDHPSPDLFLGRGYCSDDTEHTVLVARALLLSNGEPDEFERAFCRDLKRWLLLVPAGAGLATLKSIARLLFGIRPPRSGINSAGNGPAMRAALLGLCANSNDHLRSLVHRSSRITHSDPRAEQGALAVSLATRFVLDPTGQSKAEYIRWISGKVQGDQLREALQDASEFLEAGRSPTQYAAHLGCEGYVTGYVNQTVPMAIYCWGAGDDFRGIVESAVLAGGDTDSVAAVSGAIAGAECGRGKLPQQWIDQLAEWPRNVAWMDQLAERLCQPEATGKIPSLRWGRTAIRNALFASVVLFIGFRRLLPPY